MNRIAQRNCWECESGRPERVSYILYGAKQKGLQYPWFSFCQIGDRIPSMVRYMRDHPDEPRPTCNAMDLERLFCREWNGTTTKSCDEYFVRARENNLIHNESVIVGLGSGAIVQNAAPKYLSSGQLISNNESDSGQAEGTSIYYVAADISTSFMILVGGNFFKSTVA